nr:MAG: hypothetical protein TU36_03115 [Vulcanisaeta sp. AZ3]
MRNGNTRGALMIITILAAILILTITITVTPLLASSTGNNTNPINTNSTNINATSTTNTTCTSGLLTAIQANLYVDDMWLTRIGTNMSNLNMTGLPSLNLTPSTLQNITNYFISKGECLLALQFLVHLRHQLVHAYVLKKHAEIMNATLTYRLLLLNKTLTRLKKQGLLNSTEASEIYNILSQLKQALTNGNYSRAEVILSEYKSLINNITNQYYEKQKIGLANRIEHELWHYVKQLIKRSTTLNEILMNLGVLDHELSMFMNITEFNITSIKELHELYKELFKAHQLVQGNETAQIQLLQALKHGKGFNDWLNITQQFTQKAKGWQHHKHDSRGRSHKQCKG